MDLWSWKTKNYFLRFFLGQSSFLSGQDFSPFLHSPDLQESFLSQADLHFPQQDLPALFPQSDFPLAAVDVPFLESQVFFA